MSRGYKFHNPEGLYFLSFSTVEWVDVFTRIIYKDILVKSLTYCQKEKGLNLYAWVIMSNHVHLIAEARAGYILPDILRDLKKHTSRQLIKTIKENPKESRKRWMLAIFKEAGESNSNNTNYQLWQQDNHPIEIWSSHVVEQKLNYLHANPVKTGYVDKEEGYLYSSARDYHGTEKGLIEVLIL